MIVFVYHFSDVLFLAASDAKKDKNMLSLDKIKAHLLYLLINYCYKLYVTILS